MGVCRIWSRRVRRLRGTCAPIPATTRCGGRWASGRAGSLARSAPPGRRGGCSRPACTTPTCGARRVRAYPGDHRLPRALVERAGRLFDALCASAPARVVVHGDLHHDNVLRAEREPWLAIDPHGVVGDPGYEARSMVYNGYPTARP